MASRGVAYSLIQARVQGSELEFECELTSREMRRNRRKKCATVTGAIDSNWLWNILTFINANFLNGVDPNAEKQLGITKTILFFYF